jgi:hypothetical protein
MVPNNVYNGYIQGVFPPFTVQQGDHFKSLVNCEYGKRNCYAVFRLDYQVDNGPIVNLWAFGERYDSQYYQADIDLSALAGRTVKFILGINANGSPFEDRAMWVAPSIVRSGGLIEPPTATATATATATPTLPEPTFTSTPVPTSTETPTSVPTFTATVPAPVVVGTLPYINQKYGFQFVYPANSIITLSQDNFVHWNLPFTSGTNLVEKYLDLTVVENAVACNSPLAIGNAGGTLISEQVTTMNGLQFLKESGQEGAVGQFYEWTAYSIMKGTNCISLSFVLHSTNPFNYPVPPPVYNKDLESAVLLDMISSFSWTVP